MAFKHLHFFSFLFLAFCVSSCAVVTTTPAFQASSASDKIMAILPVNVSLARAKTPKGMTQHQKDSLQEAERYRYQQEIANYIEANRKKKKITIAIQDPAETNAKLMAAGFTTNWKEVDSKKMAEALGVDSYMIVDFDVAFLAPEAAVLALMALTPFTTATKEIIVDTRIRTKDIPGDAWIYQQPLRAAHSSAKSLEKLVYSKIVKRMPYKRS